MSSGPSTELPSRPSREPAPIRDLAQRVYLAALHGHDWEHLVNPDDPEQVQTAVRMAAAGTDMRRRMDDTAAVCGSWPDPGAAGWDAAIGASVAVLRGLAEIPGVTVTLADGARHVAGLTDQHQRLARHVRPDGWEPGS